MENKKITKKEVTEKLKGIFTVIGVNTKKRCFVAKKSYYYRTVKLDQLEIELKKVFPNANIIGCGDHFRPFYGGAKAGSAKDSYLYIEFNFDENN